MLIDFQLRDKDDVQKLNQIAQNHSFDVWVQSDNQLFDAKTLLALYTLPFNQPLHIVVEDDVDTSLLRKELSSL
ncbi:hypothetical protein M3221_15245 [Domibacillus indicus]|uniref:hypothetical protein n=1 Tax=Domibacillus indicus TaxID=1437523 RepID=UPI00203E87DB|nr:hypothetical protein [Domibacillus indicus]MCM3789749.1 hypothetical protein [Domibacillus indicus]